MYLAHPWSLHLLSCASLFGHSHTITCHSVRKNLTAHKRQLPASVLLYMRKKMWYTLLARDFLARNGLISKWLELEYGS